MKYLILFLFIFGSSVQVLWADDVSLLSARLQKLKKERSIEGNKLKGLIGLSKRFQLTSKRFHQSVLEDMNLKKPLNGGQLTKLHKLVSVFIDLSYQLEKEASSTKDNFLGIILRFESIRLAANTYLPLYTNEKLRTLLNAEDKAFNISKKELKKNLIQLLNKSNMDTLRLDISKAREVFSPQKMKRIERDSVFKKINIEGYFSKVRDILVKYNLSDFSNEASTLSIHQLSRAFGNSAGSVKWRSGYLFDKQEVFDEIYKKLKPLDIITEKAGFALTDTFIPGHFGHNAIWLGSKKELVELGLWDTTIPDNLKKDIEKGKLIIETDRSGTHLKSLEEFMNVDEFAILRLSKNSLPLEKYKEIYKVAFSQLGKTYDFNFDVETTDKLVCSELLYQSFGSINWPTTEYLGRTTISPDNIASLVLHSNSPLKLVYFVSGSETGHRYKSVDDLVSDTGFTKKGKTYYETVRSCKVRKLKKPGPSRRGTRASNYLNIKECKDDLNALVYKKRINTH
ncbi:MAG: hypothetical protein ACJAT2_000741 [Bacteriovoracaceae bacterium]|jgi:hypothetical protein